MKPADDAHRNGAVKFGLLLVLLIPAFCVASAATWYANAANYGRSGLDGRSEATAWGTLQDAHDNASAGDTVLVLPGDYDQGGRADTDSNNNNPNRLIVTKKLVFESTVPRAAHIVGVHAATTDGRGTGAVRCICVTTGGHGTVFKGFTIRDGATLSSGSDPLNTSGRGSTCSGGGMIVLGANAGADKNAAVRKAYLVDCVVSNCVATWGGAMHGGTAIRCLLKDNAGSSFGETACEGALWNTVVACNKSWATTGRPTLGNYTIAVNCTISGCEDVGGDRTVYLYNCVFAQQAGTEMSNVNKAPSGADSVYANCYGRASDAYPVISPATGDFRPRAGSPIVGGGATLYLTNNVVLPEGTEMTDFNGNPLGFASAACDAGAVQGAVAAKGGRLDFLSAGAEVNGFRNRRESYSYAAEWPAAVSIRPAETNFFRARLGGFTASGSPFRYADYNGLVRMLHPPFDGTVTTVTSDTYVYELWCRPDADAATADGTYAHPFRTLQAAMDCITNSQYAGKETIVRALPGDYNEGGKSNYLHMNRVSIPSSRPVLIKSTGGAAVTTIRGLADPDTLTADFYPGCGPNAMRCVVFDGTTASASSRAIQGFTLADGHSNSEDYTTDKTGDRVGGVYAGGDANSVANQILDCVFTNCAAVRGGAAYFGWHSRCKYYDCHGYGGVTRYAYLSACYVDPSCTLGPAPSDASRNMVLGVDTRVFLSTCPTADYNPSRGLGRHYGNLYGDQDVYGDCRFWGSLFRTANYINPEAQGATVADPQYVDFDGGDYRVTCTSPAISGTRLPDEGTLEWGLYVTNIWTFVSSDVNANPLRITDGKLMAGCNHEPVRGLYVSALKGGLALSGASPGFAELTSGLSFTVAFGNPGTRPCVGYTVNGATNLFEDAAVGTVTAADADADGLLVAAIYSGDWYVNADPAVGDDANTGFTPATAKRTLAAALANAVSGDTVHAASGTYAQGSRAPGGCTVAARAHVPAGVTLEGAGADKTFVVGAAAASPDAYGRGNDAVRCVYLEKGACVRGCALTGGHTRSGWSDGNAASTDWHGAGACGAASTAEDVAATRVEDCVVSNCVAICGGAGYNVTFVRSRLFKCFATRGSATERCGLENSIVDDMDSDGSSGLCVNNAFQVVNVTIGRNIRNKDGGDGYSLFYQPASTTLPEFGVVNTVVLGPGVNTTAMTNCVFVSSTTSDRRVNCRKLSAAQIALDADYCPDLATSAAVDQGLDGVGCGDTDVYGGQRVYNGRIDIGAVEADWRGRYAADICGKKAFSVTAASPGVEEAEDVLEASRVVRLPEGSTLSAAWSNGGAGSRRYGVKLRLAADSAVTVALNGEALASFSAEGEHELSFSNALAANGLAFVCAAGSAEILACSRETGMAVVVR